uniref:Uncharacterized protein n=1 Tax=Lygus hesperus TaxID=30085 RepID=A0A146MAB7_LYGHE
MFMVVDTIPTLLLTFQKCVKGVQVGHRWIPHVVAAPPPHTVDPPTATLKHVGDSTTHQPTQTLTHAIHWLVGPQYRCAGLLCTTSRSSLPPTVQIPLPQRVRNIGMGAALESVKPLHKCVRGWLFRTKRMGTWVGNLRTFLRNHLRTESGVPCRAVADPKHHRVHKCAHASENNTWVPRQPGCEHGTQCTQDVRTPDWEQLPLDVPRPVAAVLVEAEIA